MTSNSILGFYADSGKENGTYWDYRDYIVSITHSDFGRHVCRTFPPAKSCAGTFVAPSLLQSLASFM